MTAIERNETASKQLRKKKVFRTNLIIYLAVNAALVMSWAVLVIGWPNSVQISVLPNQPPLPAGFFWPIFPIVIWGALILISAYGAYRTQPTPDRQIPREALAPAPKTNIQPASQPSDERTRLRNAFLVHVLVYAVINSVLIVKWSVNGGFFWPVFLMAFWGIGVLINGYMVIRSYRRALR